MRACCREEVGRSCRGEADSDGSPPIRAMAPLSFSSSACGQARLQQSPGDLVAFAFADSEVPTPCCTGCCNCLLWPATASRGGSCAPLAVATTHASPGIQLSKASEHLLAQLIGVQPWPDQARLQLILFWAGCMVTSPYLVHIASPAFHTLAHRHMHAHCAAQRQRQLMMQQCYEACRHTPTHSVSPGCLMSACSVLSAMSSLQH